jgi:hypothetical protein
MNGFHVKHPVTGLEVYVVPLFEVGQRESGITRLEIINHADNSHPVGRILTLYKMLDDFEDIEFSYQDGEKTLKIFLT